MKNIGTLDSVLRLLGFLASDHDFFRFDGPIQIFPYISSIEYGSGKPGDSKMNSALVAAFNTLFFISFLLHKGLGLNVWILLGGGPEI